jgi:hypothetical protein
MDPKRLAVSSGSPLERALLVAGRPGRAPTGAKERALVAATAVAATAGLATTTASAGGALLKVSSIVGARWVVVLGLAGLGASAIGAAVVHERANLAAVAVGTPPVRATAAAHTPPPGTIAQPPPAAPVAAPGEPSAVVQQAPVAGAVVSAAPPASPPRPPAVALPTPAASPAAEAPSGSTTREELAWLDGARAAIRSGDPARALSVLDSYGARFPHGVMTPEATILRIEALVDAGDRPAARRAAEAFLGANPQSPYAARVRSMVPDANPRGEYP